MTKLHELLARLRASAQRSKKGRTPMMDTPSTVETESRAARANSTGSSHGSHKVSATTSEATMSCSGSRRDPRSRTRTPRAEPGIRAAVARSCGRLANGYVRVKAQYTALRRSPIFGGRPLR